MSNNTALGAENTKKEQILFISDAHEKFYYEKLKEVRLLFCAFPFSVFSLP